MSLPEWLPEAWWAWISTRSIAFCGVALLAVVLEPLMTPGRSPRVLAALWTGVLVSLAAPFGWALHLPGWTPSPLSEAAAGTAIDGGPSWTSIAFWIWLAGAAAFSAAAWVRHVRMRRRILGGTSSQVPPRVRQALGEAASRLCLRRIPQLFIAGGSCRPSVMGVFRPLVVIPRAMADSASQAELEHVFLHELEHVRRRDAAWELAFLAVHLVFWYHPLVGLARRRLTLWREVCCDQEAALRSRPSAGAYRDTLASLACRLAGLPASPLALFRRKRQILIRLAWLERPVRRVGMGTRGLSAAVCCGLIALGSMQPVTSPPLTAPVAPSPVPAAAALTTLDPTQLPGCLPRRYLVLRMLAESERQIAVAREPGVLSGS
jgi:beta-lactamase regulating signal transducer with metallopeptidase domain